VEEFLDARIKEFDILPAASSEDSYGRGAMKSSACFGGFLPQPPYFREALLLASPAIGLLDRKSLLRRKRKSKTGLISPT
jgi:hypothetical protein